jgi:hypothetical protein
VSVVGESKAHTSDQTLAGISDGLGMFPQHKKIRALADELGEDHSEGFPRHQVYANLGGGSY